MQVSTLNSTKRILSIITPVFLIVLLIASNFSHVAQAATAKEIDVSVDVVLNHFKNEVQGADGYLANAKGVLVIPNVVRVGFFFGGEYGEGALIVDGKTVDYYSTAAGSFGFQFGAQSKDIVIIFMEENALTKFRDSLGWSGGIDGSIVIVDEGAGGSLDTENAKDPIVGFIFGLKGLMLNLSLEGSKFTKLAK
jgi:lipid-binding SYLF domain-containing protein